MFLHRRPSAEFINQFILSQQDLAFSYTQVGATRSSAFDKLSGYSWDHNRIKLGHGGETYRRAVAALRSWQQFDLGWVTVVPSEKTLEVGTTVAILAKVSGFWSLNAARIVYLIDERDAEKASFGFAYGTLPDHVEQGEERFTVELNADGSVWYDLLAFSRPKHPLVKLGFPVARILQKRFCRDSMAAMRATADHLAAD